MERISSPLEPFGTGLGSSFLFPPWLWFKKPLWCMAQLLQMRGKCPCLVPNCSVVFPKGIYWWSMVQTSLQGARCCKAMQFSAVWWYQLPVPKQKASCSCRGIACEEKSPVPFPEWWDLLHLPKHGLFTVIVGGEVLLLRLHVSRKKLSIKTLLVGFGEPFFPPWRLHSFWQLWKQAQSGFSLRPLTWGYATFLPDHWAIL